MEEVSIDPIIVPATDEHQNINKRRILVLTVFFILFGIGVFFLKSGDSPKDVSVATNIRNAISGTPEPLLFQELTIPYLRSIKYDSELAQLSEVSKNSNYVSYTTSYQSDGLKINGLLTRPVGQEPTGGWPAIVFVHGYIPPTQYTTLGPQYADYVDYLASSGYVVFKIDLRGNGESEGEPGGAYYSGDYVIDTLNAYSALQNSGFVNPKKIGLWGHSMAGNVLMRSFAVKPEIPAVVIWGGAVYTYEDMTKYGIKDASYDPSQSTNERMRKRAQIRAEHGEPNLMHPFWKQLAPVSYLEDLKGAIQINHAVNDDVVNIEYSRNLNLLLDRTKVEHELIEHASGGHNISGSAFNSAMESTVGFYNKYLK